MGKFVCGVCLISIAVLQMCLSTLPLDKHKTGTKCYGDYDISYTVLSLSCPENSVIAITRIVVGSKTESSNCPESFDKNKHNTSCCEQSEDDCRFDFDTSSNTRYHLRCNGQRSCSMQAQNTLTTLRCSGDSKYLRSTSYMYIEYSCISKTNIGQFCSADKTAYDSVLHLWNSKFPMEMPAGLGTECGCSVETDNCEADIHVYSIQRNLTKESFKYGQKVGCVPEQTLTIQDSNTNRALEWTCHDNSFYIESNTVTSNYLTVNLNNTSAGNGGNFWLAFQASKSANMTLYCPSRRHQFCLDTKTATSGPSSTNIINEAPGPSTNTTIPITPLSAKNSTIATTPSASLNASSQTSPSDPTAPFSQWDVIGASTGGVVFIIIVFVLLFICRRLRTGTDKNEPKHPELILNPRFDNNPAADDAARIPDPIYFTPIHDSDYASIGSRVALRMNEPAQNRERPKSTNQQRIQRCNELAPLRNETF